MEEELGIEGVKLDEEKGLIIVEDPSKLTKEDKEKLFQLHVLFNAKDLNMEAIKNMVMELKGNIAKDIGERDIADIHVSIQNILDFSFKYLKKNEENGEVGSIEERNGFVDRILKFFEDKKTKDWVDKAESVISIVSTFFK